MSFFDISPEDAARIAEGGQLVHAYLRETHNRTLKYWRDLKPEEYTAEQTILEAEPAVQICVLLCLFSDSYSSSAISGHYMNSVFRTLSRRRLPYTSADLRLLVSFAASHPRFETTQVAVRILESQVGSTAFSDAVADAAKALRASIDQADNHPSDTSYFKLTAKLDALLGNEQAAVLKPSEAWGRAVLTDLAAMPAEERAAWNKLLAFAPNSLAMKPSGKWLVGAAAQIELLGKEAVQARVLHWFALFVQALPNRIGLPEDGEPQTSDQYDAWLAASANAAHNYAVLKGLVWCCRSLDAETVAPALGDLAWAALKKVPGLGARASKVGNACIGVLGALPGTAPISQLSRLKMRVKYPVSLRLIETALRDAAVRAGLSPEELEEFAVPTFGLDENGHLRKEFGGFIAKITLTGRGREELRWTDADGKALKSVPAEVKRDHGEAFKLLKRTADEINKTLPIQRERLERLLLSGRSWNFGDWRERYLNHPLLGCLSRRLIWRFVGADRSVLGIWNAGRLVDEAGGTLSGLGSETRVFLWHPLGTGLEIVQAWRRHLEESSIAQPFKQAHREVYLLTNAERETNTYSNRFAGHILGQHQLQALCRQRGWAYRLQGQFDGHNLPTLRLPQYGLRVEFEANGIENNGLTFPAIYLYVSTGSVSFTRTNGAALPLSEVPALLLSEIMRDVDLFVGVCSIGADPRFGEAIGAPERYAAYWRDYAFGNLSAPAKTRLDVLSRLLPHLKIASQCRLDSKFLWVQGKFKTYKIHLGSGNILMEPNDQYLCIMPDYGRVPVNHPGVFLPFEGDETLAVILSKAFLLADDASIKDAVILAQLRR